MGITKIYLSLYMCYVLFLQPNIKFKTQSQLVIFDLQNTKLAG